MCRDPWQRDSWEPCRVGLAGLGGWGALPFSGHQLGSCWRALGSRGTDVSTGSHHSGAALSTAC